MNLYDILKQKTKKQAPNGTLPNNVEENWIGDLPPDQLKALGGNGPWEQLQVGDPVIISGKGINFEGATGEVAEVGREGKFLVVDLYNHGKHSFHSSDVSYNDYADSDEEEARMYDAGELRNEVDEGADDRKQNALWAQITAHEKAAKKSKDLKQQHHLRMADQLRSQLKTVDEGEVVKFPKKHKGDLEDTHDCPKCGGDLQGGKYMGHQVQVCMPCKQVYLPPNSGIDQKGNKIKDEGVAEGLNDTQKKIEDTINKLEDRLKHAKSDEQWDRISARIERLQAGLKRSKQGVAEGQLNEYLVKAGMPVKDVLALNLFQDFDPVEGAAAQFAEFAEEPMWQQVVRKYAPIANMLKKKLLAQKRPLTDAEAEAVEQTWYDGSDAYDDMEIEYLIDIYDQQIDTLEALLAGNLTDEEFGEARAANTAGVRAGLARRANAAPLSPEEQAAKDKAKADKWLEKERAKLAAKKGSLKEFAPGAGGGESGRWYTDDQMTDLVGDGWWQDLDISGDVSKQEMMHEAQAWLADNGYRVQVLNVKVNDDDCEWFIEGSFQNSRFAKEGVAEAEAPLKHHTARVSYRKEGDPHRRYEAIFKTTHNGGKEETEKRAKSAFAAKKKIVYDIVHEQGVAEASPETTLNLLKGLKTWQVVIMNNYYRGKYSDYSGRYYYVLATSPEEAKQVVIDNADAILQELLAMKSQNGKKILPRGTAVRITPERINGVKDGTEAGRMSTAGFKKMFGPQGPMMVKLSGGAIVDVQGQEQPIGEASFDYTTKDLGNDYAGFPSNHSMKHKMLAKIKPEKQQLYKDKMNNTHDWDSLLALFKVAKARGDIIEQGVAEGVAETVPMDDAMKVLRHYGAGHFKTTSNELHFYKDGKPMSVDLTLGADSIRTVSLSQLNHAARQLKGQGAKELDEVSRGDYHKKATMGKAMAQMSAGFARSPEEREKFNQIAGRRERGLERSKARTDKFWADKAAKDEAGRLEQLRTKYAGVDIDAEIAKLKPAIDSAYHEYQYGARNTYSQGRDDYNSLMGRVQELERAKKALASNPPLSELSNKLLGDYKKAAGISARDLDKAGKYKQADKRFHGIVQATKKELDNDTKKHQQDEITESRLASMKRAGYDIK